MSEEQRARKEKEFEERKSRDYARRKAEKEENDEKRRNLFANQFNQRKAKDDADGPG